MKVEEDAPGSPSLIVRTVSVDVKQHLKKKQKKKKKIMMKKQSELSYVHYIDKAYCHLSSDTEKLSNPVHNFRRPMAVLGDRMS